MHRRIRILTALRHNFFEDGLYAAKHATGFGTYFAWGKLNEGRRIDYFMLSKSDFAVLQYHVIPVLRDGIYSSDHCPVVMDVTII